MTGTAKNQWRQGRMFIVAMLLALASALVPALFPSGLASMRLTGSAFDPTTSAVALRSRTQAIVRMAPSGDEGSTKAATAPPLATLPVIPPQETERLALSHPATDAMPAPAPRDQQRRLTRAQPRAPPRIPA